MADNILLPSHGTTVATDDVGGVHFRKVKISSGAAGVDGGLVSEVNPLPTVSSDSDAVLHHILRFLQILASRTTMPTAGQEVRVRVESTVSNMSMNAAQWGGQTAASGAGSSGNGAPRVTPAVDTVAGTPHVYAFHASMDVRNFRNRIVT